MSPRVSPWLTLVSDAVDNMDQTQRQPQHNSGPFDPSLYHRNNGAQRYAPVDAYNRNSNGYYYHGQNSQDRWVALKTLLE